MADRRTERRTEAARAAAEVLRDLGHPFDAEAVASLVRAHRGMAETCRRLWHDNRALREAMAEDRG